MSFNKDIEYCFNLIYQNKKNIKKMSAFDKYLETIPIGYIYEYPHSVVFKITQNCNLRCRHCFYNHMPDYYKQKNLFDKNNLKKIADLFVSELNIINLTITGGEPFLNENIFDFIKLLKKGNIIISIQSNGTLINPDVARELSKLFTNTADSIQISLDGSEQTSNDLLRGEGSFQKTILGIENLKKYGIKTFVNSTFTSLAANHNYPEIFNVCNELKIEKLRFSKFKLCDISQQYLVPSIENLFKYTKLLHEESLKYNSLLCKINILDIFDFLKTTMGIELLSNYIENTNIDNRTICYNCHAHNRVTIGANGDVFLCSMDDSETGVIGNVLNENFYTIWENRYSNPYFQIRQQKNEYCKKCKFLKLCKMGCIISSYKNFKNINMPPIECEYYLTLAKE